MKHMKLKDLPPVLKITDFKLTPFEQKVSDACIALWNDAQERKLPAAFSVETLYKTMSGGSTPAALQIKEISAAMSKFATQSVYWGSNADFCYLSLSRYDLQKDGQPFLGYKIWLEPQALTYAKEMGQPVPFLKSYLDPKEVRWIVRRQWDALSEKCRAAEEHRHRV